MIAEIVLIPEGLGLDAAKASAQYVARGLSFIGLKVREHISVCPDSGQFQQAVKTALLRSNVLVTIGGMGLDSGFMAKTVLSQGLKLPLVENPEALLGIREFCRKTGNPFLKTDSALAMLPRGAAVFPGNYSKLPGCAISSAKQHIIMLPETQAEIAPMFNKSVTPYLGGKPSVTITRMMRTYGVSESGVANQLIDLMDSSNPAVTLQRDGNEVLVRVAAHAETSQQAAALCTPVLQSIADRLGDSAYGLDVDSIQSAVVLKLRKKALDLAVAESGTSGMLGRMISETPGGYEFLRYATAPETLDAKIKQLGIPKKPLKKSGNVSEYAAVAAADAVREMSGATFGVSVLANTGGDTRRDCPVGVVYVAVCDANNVFVKKLIIGEGKSGSDVIVDAALSRALNMTRLMIDYHPETYPAAIPLDAALSGESVTNDLVDFENIEIDDTPPEKQKGSGRFLIHKTDKRGVKVRKFIFFLAFLVFLGSGGYVGFHYYSGYAARKQAEDLQNMFLYGEMGDVTVSPDFPRGYSLKFAGLWNVNPEVVAFISIPDTGVAYPIVQAADNDYYLRRDFYGGSNQYGIPFMDFRVDVKKPSDNIVVYGHNMKDGQIFGELIQYNPKTGNQDAALGYYRENPLIDFTTVYSDGQYKIFSVFITNAYEAQGPVFAYQDFIDASSGEDFDRFVNELKKRSMINTTVDIRQGDELLTLSTCTYEFQDARLVIAARAVRRGESPDVDVMGAGINPAPLMPDIWYQLFGGSKPIGETTPEIAAETASASGLLEIADSVTPLSAGFDLNSLDLGGSGIHAMRNAPALTELKLPRISSEDPYENRVGFRIEARESGKSKILTDELDIISRVVQLEVGSNFETEAIKAQAVAAYTFIAHANAGGNIPQVAMAPKADKRIIGIVSEVLGEMIFYDGRIAFTPYYATSAGNTTSSKAVWGGAYPYLVPVDSSVCKQAPNYKVTVTMSRREVEKRISDNLGIEPRGNPSNWFKVNSRVHNYNGNMTVCGETRNKLDGKRITGRMIREQVLNLRSSRFTIKYNSGSNEFSITTYGYGHGVGMSQNGANIYAKQGWRYKEILAHYYPGTTVE
ncbi:MAG: SpoIID/LytB domain-containing protein [Oscillospiraceae bacterium]|nr:SpoIID/LytB domain-containing protein [Oscillospiraceae bacterium]